MTHVSMQAIEFLEALHDMLIPQLSGDARSFVRFAICKYLSDGDTFAAIGVAEGRQHQWNDAGLVIGALKSSIAATTADATAANLTRPIGRAFFDFVDSATPTATTMVSMFQTGTVALKVVRYSNWSAPAAAAVSLTGVTY